MILTPQAHEKTENLCKLGIFCSAVGIKYDFKNIIFSILKYFITGHPNLNKAAFNLKIVCQMKHPSTACCDLEIGPADCEIKQIILCWIWCVLNIIAEEDIG